MEILSIITHPHVIPNFDLCYHILNLIQNYDFFFDEFRELHWKQESLHDQGTEMYRTSLKISMWQQWFNNNCTKLQEYFLCTKKTKIMTLLNNSSCHFIAPFWTVKNSIKQCMQRMYADTLFMFRLKHKQRKQWIRIHTLYTNHWCHINYFNNVLIMFLDMC